MIKILCVCCQHLSLLSVSCVSLLLTSVPLLLASFVFLLSACCNVVWCFVVNMWGFSVNISCVVVDNIWCAALVQGQRLPETFKFDALITTYEIIIADVELLTSIEWRCCIIDEAHRLKNKNCRLLEGLRLFDIVSGTLYQSLLYTYTVLFCTN